MSRLAPGNFCWADVSCVDQDRAIAFYRALFGWASVKGGPEVAGYALAHVGGEGPGPVVAGLAPKMDGQPIAAWTVSLATADAQATSELVTRHGGTVIVEPMLIPGGMGTFAVCADPPGGGFWPWEGGDRTGVA